MFIVKSVMYHVLFRRMNTCQEAALAQYLPSADPSSARDDTALARALIECEKRVYKDEISNLPNVKQELIERIETLPASS